VYWYLKSLTNVHNEIGQTTESPCIYTYKLVTVNHCSAALCGTQMPVCLTDYSEKKMSRELQSSGK
jgi:hypothetical protein